MKKFVALFFVLSLLFALPAFGADTIKIGNIATLTGDAAPYGFAESEAVKIAVDEINAAGGVLGKQLEIVLYDCRTRQEDMVNAARRLVEQDRVVAVIGPNYSGLNIAAAPIFNRAQVPQIATMSTNPTVTVDENGVTRPYNFRICFLDPYQGSVLATLAANELGLKKAAILHDVADEYSQGLREFFKEDFIKLGGEIVAEEGCRADDVDFSSQLTNIKNSGADVILFPILGRAIPLAVKQARELGIEEIIIGGDGYGDFVWEVAGDAMRNTYWVSHAERFDPDLVPLFDKFEEVTGTECREFTNVILAYDCVFWLKDAIERAGSDDPTKIRDALAATENLQLLHAVLTMDEQHNPKNKDAVILRCDTEQQRALLFMRIRPD